jgi:hypothetical protein
MGTSDIGDSVTSDRPLIWTIGGFSIVGDVVLLPALLRVGLPLTGLRKTPGPALRPES